MSKSTKNCTHEVRWLQRRYAAHMLSHTEPTWTNTHNCTCTLESVTGFNESFQKRESLTNRCTAMTTMMMMIIIIGNHQPVHICFVTPFTVLFLHTSPSSHGSESLTNTHTHTHKYTHTLGLLSTHILSHSNLSTTHSIKLKIKINRISTGPYGCNFRGAGHT